MDIPKSVDARIRLAAYINQSVQLLNEKDVLTEDLKNVADIVKEELKLTAKEYGSLVKVSYDTNKAEADVEERQTAISNMEILKRSVP
tara:strand:- start:3053 stop:3316 length:264 start_codon:yes stop_codon:yes gene_type:complete